MLILGRWQNEYGYSRYRCRFWTLSGRYIFNDLHKTLKADFIMANPPFNLSNWGQDKLKDDLRWKYGTPPAGNANYAWIQHMIHHLAPNGKIGFVLANGALSSQSSGEGEIRKNIIQADLVEGIVALPTQLFYSVTIPVTLWFISKNKKQKGKTLFIDARKMGYMVDRKHRDFTDEDIQKLSDTFTAFQDGMLEDVKGFCAVADLQEIEKQDFILTPGRYVGIEEVKDDGEPFEEKMTRLTAELSDMFAKSHELEEEIRKKLGRLGMKCKETTVALRFADTFAPSEGTIQAHQNMIDKQGVVWYGKLGAAVSSKVANLIMENENPRILLIHSGKIGRYWAYIKKLQYYIPTKSEIPEYYRDNAGVFKTWFRVVKIEEAPKNVLGNCVVASSQRPLSEVSKSSMSPYFIINVEEE